MPLPIHEAVTASFHRFIAVPLCAVLLIIPLSARSTDGGSQIAIDNFAFSPPAVTIKKGTEVTWRNQDDIPHSIVLSDIGIHSKALDTDNTFTYRFDRAGTFSYICGLQPHMHGQVVVE